MRTVYHEQLSDLDRQLGQPIRRHSGAPMADPDERTAAERTDATRQAAWSLIRRCALDGGDLRIGPPRHAPRRHGRRDTGNATGEP